MFLEKVYRIQCARWKYSHKINVDIVGLTLPLDPSAALSNQFSFFLGTHVTFYGIIIWLSYVIKTVKLTV